MATALRQQELQTQLDAALAGTNTQKLLEKYGIRVEILCRSGNQLDIVFSSNREKDTDKQHEFSKRVDVVSRNPDALIRIINTTISDMKSLFYDQRYGLDLSPLGDEDERPEERLFKLITEAKENENKNCFYHHEIYFVDKTSEDVLWQLIEIREEVVSQGDKLIAYWTDDDGGIHTIVRIDEPFDGTSDYNEEAFQYLMLKGKLQHNLRRISGEFSIDHAENLKPGGKNGKLLTPHSELESTPNIWTDLGGLTIIEDDWIPVLSRIETLSEAYSHLRLFISGIYEEAEDEAPHIAWQIMVYGIDNPS